MRVAKGEEETTTAAPAATLEAPAPAPVSGTRRPTLAARMALPEPQRSEALEQAVQSGEQFYLQLRKGVPRQESETDQQYTSRSRAGVLRQRYGEHTIEVTREPKGFSAQHAIHLLFYNPETIEEVAGS